MYQRKVKPPYKPQVESNTDTSQVDSEFTNEEAHETPQVSDSFLNLHKTDELFDNFNFVSPAHLGEEESK